MSLAADSTLADPQQVIANLRRELDECRAERDEALAQQSAAAEVLQVINASPGDLGPVFQAMLQKAHTLCEASFGALMIFDGERLHAVAHQGTPAPFREFLASGIRPEPGDPFGRMVEGAALSHTHDLSVVATRYPGDPLPRAAADLGGIRTLLVVPLRKDGALLGVITAYRQEVRPFTDKQIALLQNFAAQAVIAMENARLLTESREALEQQTATAEVLQVINSSPGDLAPVLNAMLEKALRLCGADFGLINTYDGERFHHAADHGVPAAFAEDRRKRPMDFGPGTAPARFVAGEDIVHNVDLMAEEPYERGEPNRRALVELGGARSHVAVALRKDGTLLGHLAIYRKEVRPFTVKQIALLQNFAAQAVIAMENARLLTETREALEQQTATAEVLQVINSSPGDLAPVFDAILNKAQRVCRVDHAALELYDGERMHAVAVHGASDRFAETLRQGYRATDSPAARALLEGQRFSQIADATQIDHIAFQTAAEVDGVRTVLFVPLRRDDALLGFIASARREVRPFSEKEIALLENFAAQAVIAMENARLLTETREALAQQTATAEVLGVINGSPGDLAPVFGTMLEKAMQLCEAEFGILNTYDGENFHRTAARGVPPAFEEWRLRQGRRLSGPGTRHGRIASGENVLHTLDLMAEDSYRDGDPDRRAFVELAGARTALVVALRKEGTLLGTITIFRQEVRAFTDKQIALLQNFAAQAVVAMENARLLGELRQRTEEVAELNRGLEARVAEQVDELGRVGRLKRFLAPQLAELIVSQGDEQILESHRREIVVVFCDLRGYTAFTETAEPEEVLDFLRQYHGALGPLVSQFEGTLDQFSGDGIMVFFNDPVPCAYPAERAVKMAMAMREAARELIAAWSPHGCELGFGIGIAQGYATLGQIGFSERSGYTAIGTVCNLAARLCAEAQDGQILVSSRVAGAVGALARLEDLGNVELKGLRRPVAAFNVAEQISNAPAHP